MKVKILGEEADRDDLVVCLSRQTYSNTGEGVYLALCNLKGEAVWNLLEITPDGFRRLRYGVVASHGNTMVGHDGRARLLEE